MQPGDARPGDSATVTVNTTPILPPTAVNVAAAQSDQTSQVTNSKVVNVTAAPSTSYVGITNLGFGSASPAPAMGGVLQWGFVGPGSHSATDKTSGLGMFPDTGLVAPVAFRQTTFPAAGAYTFTDTASAKTIKLERADDGHARDWVEDDEVHADVGGRGAPGRLLGGRPGAGARLVVVDVALQGEHRHVRDVYAHQGHRDVQVPLPLPAHDRHRRVRLHDGRHHQGQLIGRE